MMQGLDATHVQHHRVKWVLGGGQIMDTDWTGGVRLFSGEIPYAKQPEDSNTMFPLEDYQIALKKSEKGFWSSGMHGAVTQTVFVSRPGTLLASTLDGTILQLTQNLLEDSGSNATAEAKPTTMPKVPLKEATKKPTYSKAIYRHADAVHHMRVVDNPSTALQLVTASCGGRVTVLDMAGGKAQMAADKKLSYAPCCALSTTASSFAISFETGATHIMDTQLNSSASITVTHSGDPTVASSAMGSHSPLLALGLLDQCLQIFDLRNTSKALFHMDGAIFNGAVRSLAFAKESPHLATASDDGHIRVFDISKDAPSQLYQFKHADRATSVLWNEETASKELVSASFDGLLLRHNLASPQVMSK